MAHSGRSTTPASPAMPAGPNPLASEFHAAANRHGDAAALREKRLGLWHEVTWADYRRRAQCASVLIGRAGVRSGDAVLIVARPSVEWLAAFMGAALAGAVIVVLDESAAPADIARALASVRPSAAFTDTEALARQIAAAAPDVPILMLDAGGEALLRGPVPAASAVPEGVEAAAGSSKAGDIALMAFTAGTTRAPRPVRFTHANILNAMEHGPAAAEAGGERLAFASLARVHNLLFHVLAPLRHGGVTNFAESARTVGNDLREVAPTVLTGSPRFWCSLRNTIGRMESRAVRPGRFLLRRAMARARPSLASRMLLASVRRRFGLDRLRLAVVAGSLPPGTFLWFGRLGVRLTSRYAMTELCGIGLPADGAEGNASYNLCLGATGEILIRSPAVPTDCLDGDGWFHSGDAGHTGRDGISVLGRVGADRAGSSDPACTVEREIAKSEYVVDCVVSGGGERLSALVAVDEHVRLAAQSLRRGRESQDETIAELLDADLARITGEPGWLRRRAAITIVHADAQDDDDRFTPCSRLRRGHELSAAAGLHSVEGDAHV